MDKCSTIFDGRFRLTRLQTLSVGISIAVISFLTVGINFILIAALRKTKQLNNSTNIYIFLLSLSDCLQGAVSMPLCAFLFLTYENQTKCQLVFTAEALSLFHGSFSGFVTLLIGVDRYMNIRPKFSEDNCCLKKLKTKCGSVTLTCLCFVWSVASVGLLNLEKNLGNALISIGVGTIDIFGVVTIYTLYIRMYVKIIRQVKTSVVYRKEKVQKKSTEMPQYTRELAKTIFVIIIIIAACYLPFLLLHIYITNTGGITISNGLQFSYYLSLLPISVNASLNACIILYRNKRLQGYLRQTACMLLPTQNIRHSKSEKSAAKNVL